MAEKNFNARFKQKHDVEANWAKATFAPLAGEFIVYDIDENNSTPRIKIGDGETQINDLPFIDKGKMNCLGTVNALPQTANEGDICFLTSGQALDLVANGFSELRENSLVVLGYDGTILSLAESNLQKLQVLDAVVNFITGNTSLQNTTFSEPKQIKLDIDNNIFVLNITRLNYSDEGGSCYRVDLYGTIEPNTEYYFFNEASKVVMSYGDVSSTLMIYHNGAWEELTPSLEGYATEEYVDEKVSEIIPSDAKNVRSFTTSGSGSSYTATISNYTAYTKGDIFIMIPHTTATTTSPRLNINNLGYKYIYRNNYSSGSTTSLRSTTELSASYPVMLIYNGNYFIMVDNKQPYGDTDFYNKISSTKLGAGTMIYQGPVNSLAEINTYDIQNGYTYKPTIIKDDRSLEITIFGVDNIRSITTYEGFEDWGEYAVVNFYTESDITKFLCAAYEGMCNNNYNWSMQVGSYIYEGSWITTTTHDQNYTYSFITELSLELADEIFVNGATAICKIEATPYLPSDLQNRLQGELITNDSETLYMYDGDKFIPYTAAGGNNNAGLAGENSGPKTIGFTDNCDYVATSTDGLTAFAQAIAEATDGDTILVLSGEYKGETTLNIDKDLTFIAVGDVVINFDVKTQGGGVFSYENWEWTEIYESKHTKWDGFTFKKSFIVGIECNPDNAYYNGFATAKNCSFNGYTTIVGNCYNCDFNSSITIGHYYGADSSTFTDCRFSCSIEANVGSDNFKRCDFHFNGNNSVNITTWKEDNFVNCKMYAPNDILIIRDSHSSGDTNLNDTVVFAVGVVNDNSYSINGGYLVSYTPIGGTSSGGGTTAEYVTRTEMEEYVNETIIGGEW